MKEPVKIETETIETWRNKKTGKVYNSADEVVMDLTSDPNDIVKDVTIKVTNKGLDLLQKVMQNGKTKA